MIERFAVTISKAPIKATITALSRNGFDYYALNDDKPIVSTDSISTTGGVRDPHILRGEDGNFYMVLTDLKTDNGWSNTEIILAKANRGFSIIINDKRSRFM